MSVLNGKRALVCGSSQGIGFACAQEIAKLGAEVTLFARNESSLKEAVGKLNTDAGQTHGFICADFTDAPSVRDAAASFVEKTGPIHILVNNTGGPAAGPLADCDDANPHLQRERRGTTSHRGGRRHAVRDRQTRNSGAGR
ncbi:MAG: SDR family NAD(P)-dependent oxidoreductase [Planctomycetes bacterium]|nr:SDR family NAD(P)-dependent oxidoreductase [Planctomycetota bacterium]